MSGYVAVSRELWNDPDFDDAVMSQREAWIWLCCMGDRTGYFDVTRHDSERQIGWTWQRSRQVFFRWQRRGLVQRLSWDRSRASGVVVRRHVRSSTAPIHVDYLGAPFGPALREGIPAPLRSDILAAGRCSYCGCTDGPFHVDHIIPVSKGGRSNPENLTCACAGCNLSKGGKLLSEWRASQ